MASGRPFFKRTRSQCLSAGSTDNLILFQLEDDTYYFGNTEVQSGDTVTADDGNEYTLTRDSATRMWTAMFEGGEITVALGDSGESVVLTRRADDTYREGRRAVLDRNGCLFQCRRRLQTGIDGERVDDEDLLC